LIPRDHAIETELVRKAHLVSINPPDLLQSAAIIVRHVTPIIDKSPQLRK
jgi:hypothetical protein